MTAIQNIFSVDLEDWHPLIERRIAGGSLPPPTRNVWRQTERLLELLARHGAQATFFTLGALAEHFPDLVRRVADQGHEIGCHGHEHHLVYRLSPGEFRRDTIRAKALLEDVVGRPVVGYRAAEFSISHARALPWSLEILAELGFHYDSSIFPISGRRYGLPAFSSEPHRYALTGDANLVEFPLSTYRLGRRALPVAGGGYFRVLPLGVLSRAVEQANSTGRPFVTYFHPYEFDDRRLNVFESFTPRDLKQRLAGLRYNTHQNIGRASIVRKLDALLGRFPFTTFERYLDHAEISGGRQLLSSYG